jgi:flagellar motor switch protein FliM
MINTEDSTSSSTAVEMKERQIQACNFRYAGRLSNENARTLTMLSETFATASANSLEAYLGAAVQLSLISLDQASIQDYLSTLTADSYLVPCALGVMDSSFLMQLDTTLVFPLIDLLLGGIGSEGVAQRELTDIDEEIMQGVSTLLMNEIDRSWSIPNLNYTLGHCVKAATLAPLFIANEKVVILLFQMSVANAGGYLRIVLPTSFVGYLLRHQRAAQVKKPTRMNQQPRPSLRQRMLDCTYLVSTDITQMRVMVKDLLTLEPGKILIMKAPVKRNGRLTIEGVDVFEAAVVRSGTRKAAQLLPRSPEVTAEKSL